jgi:two-component system cell cycle response regulator DivK
MLRKVAVGRVGCYAGSVPRGQAEPGRMEGAQAERPVILLVEDDPDLRALAVKVLASRGYSSIPAADGEEGVRIALEGAASLVLMDLDMPELDGLEATRRIKRARPGIPVVAVTGHAMSGDRDEAREAGCDAFLPKPYEIQQLVAIVDRLLGRAPN